MVSLPRMGEIKMRGRGPGSFGANQMIWIGSELPGIKRVTSFTE